MGHKILVWTVIGWLAVSAIPATGAPGDASESRKVHFALMVTLALGITPSCLVRP